ncbi:trypsin-like serine peptidase [Lentzea albidocapillata]|uniref:V8-like Glu-specific endopeptidase n=1 Tax=Lentzea albidocapillata TaxID=40571 RepID=A0A1W2EDM3_9PSEU|nr:serine protease [Lentzea albidocapillata]SMD07492.1 V8-like Glu-specific endopeptidase [Lentzea albidocapillata]
MRKTLQLLTALALALPMTTIVPATTTSTPAEASSPQTQQIGTEESVSVRVGGANRSTVIERPGSGYVKLHFTDLRILPGDVLTVSSPDGTEKYTHTRDLKASLTATLDASGFWAMSITGDRAVVSVTNPLSRVRIDKLTRGYTEAEMSSQPSVQSICGTNDYRDAVCYQSSNPTEWGKTKSVAKLLRNGSSLCTAWRVGPNNRMLTNEHCFTSTSGIEVWFNYQCPTCGGTASAAVTKVLAAQVLKYSAALDYTLFTVNNFAAISSFGYLELDARVPAVGEEMYIVGHPAGKLKKLSLRDNNNGGGYCVVRAVRVNGSSSQSDISYMCDTEGGSSGSPVLSRRTHKVIGLHHFGGCPNQGVRIDLVAAQINSLL